MPPDDERPFRREKYGISFALELAEWPNDVPLPLDATESVRGPKRLPPRREIDLKPKQTVDRVRGLFDVPQSLETVTEWYRHEMKRLGWVMEKDNGLAKSDGPSHWLEFHHPDKKAMAKIFLQFYPYNNTTSVFTQRVAVYSDCSDPESPEMTLS